MDVVKLALLAFLLSGCGGGGPTIVPSGGGGGGSRVTYGIDLSTGELRAIVILSGNSKTTPAKEFGQTYQYANDRPDLPYTFNKYGYCKTYIK